MTMLGFLQGEEKDNKGRYLFDYWEADNQWLEETHDYIQWMFPLDVRSFHHPFVAPALKNDEIEIAKHDEYSEQYDNVFSKNFGILWIKIK